MTRQSANAIVEDDVNTSTYHGFRASIKTELNDNWDALISVANQTIESTYKSAVPQSPVGTLPGAKAVYVT